MSKEVSKIERLMNLVAYFLNSRVVEPLSNLVGKIEGYDESLSPANIEKRWQRDRKDLEELGFVFEYVEEDGWGQSGYRLRKDSAVMPKLNLTSEEFALLELVRSTSSTLPRTLSELVGSAVTKLCHDHPMAEEIGPTQGAISPESTVDVYEPKHLTELETVLNALFDRSTIAFDYRSGSNSDAKRRKLDIYGVGGFRGSWYVVGYDHVADGVRMFNVERIEGDVALDPEGNAGSYDIPASFDIREHIGRAPWRIGTGGQGEVIVDVDKTVCWMIRREFDDVRVIEGASDGFERLAFAVNNPAALKQYLLGFGTRFKVVEPSGFREGVESSVQKALARYECDPANKVQD
ncbi:MAG: WYL domain-containing protein [Planctomycetes bacterium]|nr:WYL domain-containing protein [Planctomycetota bacterium]